MDSEQLVLLALFTTHQRAVLATPGIIYRVVLVAGSNASVRMELLTVVPVVQRMPRHDVPRATADITR